MKIHPISRFLVLFFLGIPLFVELQLLAQAPQAPKEDPEFVEARRFFWSGQYNEAEKQFKVYLMEHPDHKPSKSFLQMIVQSQIYSPSKIEETRRRLERIRVKQVELKNADWRSVSSYLQNLANPKVDGKEPKNYINFISLLPSGFSVEISLNLRDVTLMHAIEHACRQAGLRYVVDTWAVIVDLPQSKK